MTTRDRQTATLPRLPSGRLVFAAAIPSSPNVVTTDLSRITVAVSPIDVKYTREPAAVPFSHPNKVVRSGMSSSQQQYRSGGRDGATRKRRRQSMSQATQPGRYRADAPRVLARWMVWYGCGRPEGCSGCSERIGVHAVDLGSSGSDSGSDKSGLANTQTRTGASLRPSVLTTNSAGGR